MGSCQPGQGRKSAAISSPLQVRWASHRQPMASMSEPANTSADTTGGPAAPAAPPRHYVVVARRYRPQTFDELVGQEHVAQALSNAIATSGWAMPTSSPGRAGVGKTSAARILAKALNCAAGPHRRALQPVRHLPQHQRRRRRRRAGDRRGQQSRHRRDPRSCGRTSTCVPAGRASRFTSSTKCTCSPARPSTPC